MERGMGSRPYFDDRGSFHSSWTSHFCRLERRGREEGAERVSINANVTAVPVTCSFLP